MLIRHCILGTLLLCILGVNAQNELHPTGLSVGYAALRYMPPPGSATAAGTYRPGLVLSFNRSLSGALDFRTQLAGGLSMDNPAWESGGVQGSWMLDISYQLVFRPLNGWLLRRESLLSPYVVSGIGGSYQPGAPDAYVPLGGGIRVRPTSRFHIQAEVLRKLSLNDDYQHLAYLLSFVYNIGKNEAESLLPSELKPDGDRDQDGIADSQDDCPDEAGSPALLGCPGASDTPPDFLQPEIRPLSPVSIELLRHTYECAPPPPPRMMPGSPKEAETPEAHEDVAERVPEDAPLALPGEAEEATSESVQAEAQPEGCTPATFSEASLQSVYFAQASEQLSPDAKQQLDRVAALMQSCPTLRLVLEGHTDDSGSARDNLVLSILRAYNVKYYLVYQYGISQSRITSRGLGEQQPAGDNRSATGAQQNRRVALIFVY